MTKLLTLREVAELLRVSQKTVRRMAHRGELTYFRVGWQLRFPINDVERYLSQRCVPAIRA